MTKQSTRDLILWITFFTGPVLWLISFQAKLSWGTWVCASESKIGLFVFAVLAFLLSSVAGFLAWGQWKELGSQDPGEAHDSLARSRFMAVCAMAFSAAFCLVIVAQAIPDLILEACQ